MAWIWRWGLDWGFDLTCCHSEEFPEANVLCWVTSVSGFQSIFQSGLVSMKNVKYLAAQSLAASRRMCCWPCSTSSLGMSWALTLQSVLEKHWTPWGCRKHTLRQSPLLLHTEKPKCENDAKGSRAWSQFWVLRKQESPSCSCPNTSSTLLSRSMHFNIFFWHQCFFFTISWIATSLPSFQCNHCLRESALLLSWDWRNAHGDIQFVTGNSDLCHLVLSHKALKTTCPNAATCILLSAALWSLEQLKALYVSSSAWSRVSC